MQYFSGLGVFNKTFQFFYFLEVHFLLFCSNSRKLWKYDLIFLILRQVELWSFMLGRKQQLKSGRWVFKDSFFIFLANKIDKGVGLKSVHSIAVLKACSTSILAAFCPCSCWLCCLYSWESSHWRAVCDYIWKKILKTSDYPRGNILSILLVFD